MYIVHNVPYYTTYYVTKVPYNTIYYITKCTISKYDQIRLQIVKYTIFLNKLHQDLWQRKRRIITYNFNYTQLNNIQHGILDNSMWGYYKDFTANREMEKNQQKPSKGTKSLGTTTLVQYLLWQDALHEMIQEMIQEISFRVCTGWPLTWRQLKQWLVVERCGESTLGTHGDPGCWGGWGRNLFEISLNL